VQRLRAAAMKVSALPTALPSRRNSKESESCKTLRVVGLNLSVYASGVSINAAHTVFESKLGKPITRFAISEIQPHSGRSSLCRSQGEMSQENNSAYDRSLQDNSEYDRSKKIVYAHSGSL
jgi:hypothetical protein